MSKRALAAALFLQSLLLCIPARAESAQDLQLLLKQGQFSRVVERADAALSAKPRDAQLRFLKGVALVELNRNAEAITIFQKLAEDYPDLPEPYNNLAVLYAQQKQYEKARVALETAIRTHPSYATAHENLGDIYARLASQAYDKALSLDSSNAAAQNKLSMIREIMSLPRASQPAPAAIATVPPPARPTPPPSAAPVAKAAPASIPATPAPAPVVAAPATAPTARENTKTEPKHASETGDDAARSAAAVTKTVQNWAAAWSRKDVKGYLACYSRDFTPPKGQNRKAWEDERNQRLSKPGEIEVRIEDLKVVGIDSSRATVKLRQNYRSANLSSSSGKTLILVWQDGRWLIQQERVGN
ncbi:MAG: tetratricopeptide repeat protein [Proteobacteria bacterium]|nr:tetratricopeptide repeat protein [Pseudomonadota bacterium]